MKRLIIIFGVLFLFSTTVSAAITYDSDNNTITVTGYTEETPCTFTNIYNADQSAGWGVVSKQGDAQFYITANFNIGDDSTTTYFTDIGKGFQIGTPDARRFFCVKKYAIATFTNCFFRSYTPGGISHNRDAGDMYWIGSTVFGDSDNYIFTINSPGCLHMWNSYLKTPSLYNELGQLDVIDSVFELSRVHWLIVSPTINGYTLKNSKSGIDAGYNKNIIFKRLKFDNCSKQIQLPGWAYDYCYFTALDPITPIDGSKLVLDDDNRIVWVKYSFNLSIIDENNNPINGATVEIWDCDGSKVTLITDENGDIPQQILTKEKYDHSHCPTPISYNNFTIQISKIGYQTYKATFTLDDKIDWTIALQKYNNTCNNTCNNMCNNMLSTEINLIDQKYHEYTHIGYQTMHIPIYTGFNYISIPLYQYNTSLAALFDNHPVTNDTMKKYTNGTWDVSSYNNGTWVNASDIEPIEPCIGYEYNRIGNNFTLNISGFMKYDIDIFNYKNRVGTNIIRPMRSDKDD